MSASAQDAPRRAAAGTALHSRARRMRRTLRRPAAGHSERAARVCSGAATAVRYLVVYLSFHHVEKPKRVVADTSVLINGQLEGRVSAGEMRNHEIIIPQVVYDELYAQANGHRQQGWAGLEALRRLFEAAAEAAITVTVHGNHATSEEIGLAADGRLDNIINDAAKRLRATLYTADRLQQLAAQASGVDAVLLRADITEEDLEFTKYFDSDTMSVHLKEGMPPVAKRGGPGSFIMVTLEEEPLGRDYLERIASKIIDSARNSRGMMEIEKPGAAVVQYGDYRIAITRPPFSEAVEITIVHPLVKMSLEEYDLSEELMERFADRAEGVVISGPPGSGKSTLASGLAEFYSQRGKIVKTFESPRDLQVNPNITQYTKLDGSFENSADILLLVRPDYTIFDEVRRREDFDTFADLRLTGVGMVGVVHANSPMDGIQRFIGKVELGIIPNVLDTVVFVKDGGVEKVYELELKVKVPSGMTEADLARPVIEVRDFVTKSLEHEIYTFGQENVIVPVHDASAKGIGGLAEERIRAIFEKYDPNVAVEILTDNKVVVRVEKQYIPSIIGRRGSNIGDLERKLGISIDVEESDGEPAESGTEVPAGFSESKNALLLDVGSQYASMPAAIYVDDTFLTSRRVGRKGQIKLPKRSEAAHRLIDLASAEGNVRVIIRDSQTPQ